MCSVKNTIKRLTVNGGFFISKIGSEKASVFRLISVIKPETERKCYPMQIGQIISPLGGVKKERG